MSLSSAVVSSPIIDELRSLIKSVERPAHVERHPFTSTPLGIPRGALIEMTGHGKTEKIIQFLAENPRLRVAWIEDQFSVYPCAFIQRKVNLQRILFIETKTEFYWAASQVLRSGLFEVVVLNFRNPLQEKTVRRLQLETEKANVSFFLLPEKEKTVSAAASSWPISMRLKINSINGRISVLRERG